MLSQTLCPVKNAKGRVAAYEFMVVTSAIANLIRENKVYRIESSIQTGKNVGMQLLDDHLWELYEADKITLDIMLEKARIPAAMMDKAQKLQKERGGRALEGGGPVLQT